MTTIACDRALHHVDAFVRGELEAATAGLITSHLAECAACRAEADLARHIAHGLGAMRQPAPPQVLARALAGARAVTSERRMAWFTASRALAAGLLLTVIFLLTPRGRELWSPMDMDAPAPVLRMTPPTPFATTTASPAAPAATPAAPATPAVPELTPSLHGTAVNPEGASATPSRRTWPPASTTPALSTPAFSRTAPPVMLRPSAAASPAPVMATTSGAAPGAARSANPSWTGNVLASGAVDGSMRGSAQDVIQDAAQAASPKMFVADENRAQPLADNAPVFVTSAAGAATNFAAIAVPPRAVATSPAPSRELLESSGGSSSRAGTPKFFFARALAEPENTLVNSFTQAHRLRRTLADTSTPNRAGSLRLP